MQTMTQAKYLRAAINADKARGRRVALVPTMGHLHEGHLQLVRRAHEVAGVVVVSIFVNPMQFGASEDLDNYPKTLAEDQQKLESEDVHYLFVPEVEEMYPNGIDKHTRVNVDSLADMLCGINRPSHFEGVCTVVCKLFNLVQPTNAVFGEKDFQQLAIIKRMVSDLCMPVDIIGVPTARAHDGLALSSRNTYLNSVNRARAPALYETLKKMRDRILAGDTQYESMSGEANQLLVSAGFDVDYFEIRDPHDLTLLENGAVVTEATLFAAASLGPTRLIDNISVKIK